MSTQQPPTEFDAQVGDVSITADTYSTALRAAARAADLIENEACAVRAVRSEQAPPGKVKLVLDFTKVEPVTTDAQKP